MYDDERNFVLIVIAVVVVVIAAAFALDRAACYSAWRDSGYGVRWGGLSGCRIEVTPGKWTPARQTFKVQE